MASQTAITTKRKLSDDEEIEVNLDAPEPPSKRAKRKEKKAQSSSTRNTAVKPDTTGASEPSTPVVAASTPKTDPETTQVAPKRSEHGIWIGNLPFDATKESLREFLLAQGGIGEEDMTRVHLPTSTTTDPVRGKRTQNKGFAYVDFTSKATMQLAVSLSEKLMKGRRVLIKDSKSFEGRPAKTEKTEKTSEAASGIKIGGKEPSKKVFVGNLGFDITKEDLVEHFSQAGEVEDVFMATFEDTGKCKGFAWLRFTTIEAAQAAVKGFIHKSPSEDSEDEDDHEEDDAGGSESGKEEDEKPKATKVKKKRKPQKWFINRLNGRQLRCEFAEDAQTRYKKRYGKDAKNSRDKENAGLGEVNDHGAEPASGQDVRSEKPRAYQAKARFSQPDKEQRREDRRQRHEKMDARNIAPGRALANAPRNSGAIVTAKGTKMTFDD